MQSRASYSLSLRLSSIFALLGSVASGVLGDDQILGVKGDQLIQAVGITQPIDSRAIGPFAVQYSFSLVHERSVQSLGISVAITPAQAEQRGNDLLQFVPTGETWSAEPAGLGDQRCALRGKGRASESARFIFRRNNVLVNLSTNLGYDAGLDLARRIDDILKNNRTIAPIGAWSQQPEIVVQSVPGPVRAGEKVRFSPEFRGLGEQDRVKLMVRTSATEPGGSINRVKPDGQPQDSFWPSTRDGKPAPITSAERPAAGEDWRFVIDIPHRTSPGPLKLWLVAANDDNVVVRKEIELQVVAD